MDCSKGRADEACRLLDLAPKTQPCGEHRYKVLAIDWAHYIYLANRTNLASVSRCNTV